MAVLAAMAVLWGCDSGGGEETFAETSRPQNDALTDVLAQDASDGDDAPSCVPTVEVCNGLDDDCDGATDEERVCDTGCAPASEVCNGLDDDCDGMTDEGGVCEATCQPTAEVCNGLDDDCDSVIDEDGVCDPACQPTTEVCNGLDDDCDDVIDEDGVCDPACVPALEVCNALDDDCDGATDEGGVCDAGPTPSVCYPGASNSGELCFDLVPLTSISSSDYDYPSSDDPRYRKPVNLLDLTTVDPSTKLSANFALDELMQESKGRWAIFSPMTVARIQAVRSALGVPVYVNSAYRNPTYNASVGGATLSRHMYGDAVDIQTQGATSLTAIDSACENQGASFTLVYDSHVHCDWRNDPLPADYWPPAAAGPTVPGGVDDAGPLSGGLWATAVLVGEGATPRVGDRIVVEAQWGPGFDEGVPLIRWAVSRDGNSIATRERTARLEFDASAPGDYLISWSIGGLFRGEIALDVE